MCLSVELTPRVHKQHRTQILEFNVNFKDLICMLLQSQSETLNPSQANANFQQSLSFAVTGLNTTTDNVTSFQTLCSPTSTIVSLLHKYKRKTLKWIHRVTVILMLLTHTHEFSLQAFCTNLRSKKTMKMSPCDGRDLIAREALIIYRTRSKRCCRCLREILSIWTCAPLQETDSCVAARMTQDSTPTAPSAFESFILLLLRSFSFFFRLWIDMRID